MATNFFEQQDVAKRNTKLLILLFCLAVLSLVALTNLLVMLCFSVVQGTQTLHLPWEVSVSISLVVVAVIGLAIMAKWQQLKLGGRTVAQALGGTRLSADSQDPLQRRALNVVEEMALAANLPVPPVFLLPEQGINAFAAGYSPADAVIGITQGALSQLNRDELQGVIAHEFSHILNGDMRMNIRLIAILNGILFIGHLGYYLLRAGQTSRVITSRRNKNDGTAGLMLIGVGLIVIGYLGSFFGNIIKAAVSRQREYLADASAVQFSRNPRGIAGALKRIGGFSAGSRIKHGNADEISHLFFGEAISRWAAVFATHPPLTKRIRRLEPTWNGKFIPADGSPSLAPGPGYSPEQSQERQRQAIFVALPALLTQSSHQTQPAQAIVCAMLLHPAHLANQLQLIKRIGGQSLLTDVDRVADAMQQLPLAQQVHLLQMVIPALKQLSSAAFQQFHQLLTQMAGPAPTLTQWLCLSFVEHVVKSEFDSKQVISRHHTRSITDIQTPLLTLLSAVSDTAGSPNASMQAWQAALQSLHMTTAPAKPSVHLPDLNDALPVLLSASPAVKQRIWQSILAAINADKQLTDAEQGLQNLLALLLEMPIADPALF